jgi:hypothetical protein
VIADSAGSGRWDGVAEPRIVLAIKTLSTWTCGGRLEADLSSTSTNGAVTTVVEVKRVFPSPQPCLGYDDVAAFAQHLPVGWGEHTLRVVAQGETHEFKLRVSDAAIDLARVGPVLPAALLRRRLVDQEFSTFWRFPPRSLAFYCDASAAPEVCEAVARLLSTTVGLTPFQFGPDGHPPFPLPEAGSPMQIRYFLYSREEDLRQATQQLCSAHERTRLTMGFWSWRNESSNSALCR